MLSLSAKVRKDFGKKVKILRQRDILPAVLYGSKIKKTQSLELDYKAFEKVYKTAGEGSLISLEIDELRSSSPFANARVIEGGDPEGKPLVVYGAGKKIPVLIHEIQKNPLTGKISHVDFYQPSLEEKTVVKIPIVLEGISPAVKESGGTLVKYISEVEVKALPQNLPKEIKINVENLNTFEDNILIKDLKLPEGVEILRNSNDIVASVLPPEKVEEELEKSIEEKVEEVKIVEEKKPSEAEIAEEEEIKETKQKASQRG